MNLKELEEQYNQGIEILKQFHNLSDKDIKNIIRDIVGEDSEYDLILSDKSYTTRTITNEVVENITISYYDSIVITFNGISYISEHHKSEPIIKFSKYFSLKS